MIVVIILLMMKFKIGNFLTVWMGVNLFPLYIYQRLPMIVLSNYITCNPYILFVLSFALACAIVPVYKRIQINI